MSSYGLALVEPTCNVRLSGLWYSPSQPLGLESRAAARGTRALGVHTSYAKLDQDDLHVLSQDVFLLVLKILRFLVTDLNRIYCSWHSPGFKKNLKCNLQISFT